MTASEIISTGYASNCYFGKPIAPMRNKLMMLWENDANARTVEQEHVTTEDGWTVKVVKAAFQNIAQVGVALKRLWDQ